ncbi:hypothetical protein, partial [Gordonia otitidis]|uniref:hypothetical protein n=1 Tax=Gordonia otitidis TaxID=249058 RepID=UPI0023569C82
QASRLSTQSQIREKNLTKQKLATPGPASERYKKSSHNPKTWTHDAKYGIRQFITHYRVLKERTPTGATPKRA